MLKGTGFGVAVSPVVPMVSVTKTFTDPEVVFNVTVSVYVPLAKFVLVTEKVAFDWTAVTLRKLTPPEPRIKELPVTAVSWPLIATETVCGGTDPPVTALNVREGGLAVTPPLPTFKLTLSWEDWAPLAWTVI